MTSSSVNARYGKIEITDLANKGVFENEKEDVEEKGFFFFKIFFCS